MADQSGFASLGAALGGDSELQYQQGLALGANTQVALATARERVEKARAQMNLADQLTAAGLPENLARASATTLTAGGNLGDVIGALNKNQEHGFRDIAGSPDPNVDAGARNRALTGVSSGPVKPFEAVGAHGYQDIYHPELGVQSLGDSIGGGGDSASIQNLRAFGLLGPDGHIDPKNRELAYEILRNTSANVDVGGVPAVRTGNPFHNQTVPTRPATPTLTPLATPEQTAANAAGIAGGKKEAELRTEANVSLPDTLANVDKLKTSVQGLLQEPGFDTIYGARAGTDTGKAITGLFSQDSANAQARLGNIDAQTFGVTIQQMRGLGQLSNQEGLKVTNAFTRANNTRLSPEEAKAAWGEVLHYLDLAAGRAQQKATGIPPSGGGSGGAAPAAFNTEAEAAAAGLAPGTRITIGGVPGTWQ